jgi:hypothetical protein
MIQNAGVTGQVQPLAVMFFVVFVVAPLEQQRTITGSCEATSPPDQARPLRDGSEGDYANVT